MRYFRVCWQGGINIRSGPSLDNEVTGVLNQGEVFQSFERRGAWVSHARGWVAIRVNRTALLEPLATVPTPFGDGALLRCQVERGAPAGADGMCKVRLRFATAYVRSRMVRRLIYTKRALLLRRAIARDRIGMQVSTPYGDGTLIMQRPDAICLVLLRDARAYMHQRRLSAPHGIMADPQKRGRLEHIQLLDDVIAGRRPLPSLRECLDGRRFREVMRGSDLRQPPSQPGSPQKPMRAPRPRRGPSTPQAAGMPRRPPRPPRGAMTPKAGGPMQRPPLRRSNTEDSYMRGRARSVGSAMAAGPGDSRSDSERLVRRAMLSGDESSSSAVASSPNTPVRRRRERKLSLSRIIYLNFTLQLETVALDKIERERFHYFFNVFQNAFEPYPAEKAGVHVFSPRGDEFKGQILVKATTLVAGSVDEMTRFLTEPRGFEDRMRCWDDTFSEGERFRIGDSKYLVRLTLGMPMPATARDFVVYNRVVRLPNGVASVYWSCKWTKHPPDTSYFPSYVRGHIACAGHLVEPLGSNLCRITYLLQADPRGTLPKWMAPMVSEDQSEKLANLRAFYSRIVRDGDQHKSPFEQASPGRDALRNNVLSPFKVPTTRSASADVVQTRGTPGSPPMARTRSATALAQITSPLATPASPGIVPASPGQRPLGLGSPGPGSPPQMALGSPQMATEPPLGRRQAWARGIEQKVAQGPAAQPGLSTEQTLQRGGPQPGLPPEPAPDDEIPDIPLDHSDEEPVQGGDEKRAPGLRAEEERRVAAVRQVFSLARHGRVKELHQMLIQNELPAIVTDDHGNTLLHIAAQNNNRRLAKWGLRFGINPRQTNAKGLCAIRYCMRYKYTELGDYLLHKQTLFEEQQKRARFGIHSSSAR